MHKEAKQIELSGYSKVVIYSHSPTDMTAQLHFTGLGLQPEARCIAMH